MPSVAAYFHSTGPSSFDHNVVEGIITTHMDDVTSGYSLVHDAKSISCVPWLNSNCGTTDQPQAQLLKSSLIDRRLHEHVECK
ncbi:hypothetical protein DAI22_08g130500 [Oryza sativa Japonica Group]|nr:hypothetical protein DAI22_08g130500 [Oryza sativa Japonica Group]